MEGSPWATRPRFFPPRSHVLTGLSAIPDLPLVFTPASSTARTFPPRTPKLPPKLPPQTADEGQPLVDVEAVTALAGVLRQAGRDDLSPAAAIAAAANDPVLLRLLPGCTPLLVRQDGDDAAGDDHRRPSSSTYPPVIFGVVAYHAQHTDDLDTVFSAQPPVRQEQVVCAPPAALAPLLNDPVVGAVLLRLAAAGGPSDASTRALARTVLDRVLPTLPSVRTLELTLGQGFWRNALFSLCPEPGAGGGASPVSNRPRGDSSVDRSPSSSTDAG